MSRKSKPEGEAQAADGCRAAALRLLARREHGEAELTAKLAHRGHGQDAITATVADLRERGMLSEQRFLDAVREVRQRRGFGPLRVARDLRSRGVDAVAANAAAGARDGDWDSVARAIRRRRFGAAPPADYREWTRQARFLQGRGFTTEQIRRVLGSGDEPTDV